MSSEQPSPTHPSSARSRRVDLGWVALLILFLLSLPLVTPRLYAVDSVEYFVYLPSLIFDGDLDFYDEYTHFIQRNPDAGIEGVRDKRDPATGLPLNVAPVGTAVLWAPFYLLVHAGLLLARSLGAAVVADGLSRPYILVVCYASVGYAFAGLLLSYRLCRWFFSSLASALAVALAWLATPAFFYSHVSPPWSHSASLFTVALFVTVWYETRGERTPAQFLVLGLLGGLMALVREQNGLFLLMPAIEGLLAYGEILRRWWGARAPGPGDAAPASGRSPLTALLPLLGRHLLLVGGVVLAFLPQLAAYRVLNGRFGPNPTVGYKFTWSAPYFFRVLGDPHYGLLVWSPVLVFALWGLVCVYRRDRLLAVASGVAFLSQVYILGAFLTWHGAGSFGQRRFINCTVLFALGLAALISWLRAKGWPGWVLVGLGGLLVVWNGGLIVHWIRYQADRQAGLVWRHLPRRIFWEIPQQGPDLIRRLLFDRSSLYENQGN